jgi:hypothetical protein
MHYLIALSLADTASIGHYGLYLDTSIAEVPELVNTIISFAFIS